MNCGHLPKTKIFNTISVSLNKKISMRNCYIQWSQNVEIEKDKKQYHHNIEPQLKVENQIKGNEIISHLKFNLIVYRINILLNLKNVLN